MQKEITREQFWEIYKNLPKELQDAIFSEKTADIISTACSNSGVKDGRTPAIAKQVGNVLLGKLPIHEFKLTLDLDIDLEPSQAQNIYSVINSQVFEPVKPQLQEISAPGWKPKIEDAPAENITETVGTETDAYEEPIISEEKIKISKDNLPIPEPISEAPIPVPPPSLEQRIKKMPATKASEEPPVPPKGSDSYREPVG